MFRSAIATARSNGIRAAPLRPSATRQAIRSFASEPPKPAESAAPKAAAAAATAAAGSSSNVPLVLALGGLGGLGAWYYMGGFGDQKPGVPGLAATKPGALDRQEFKEFTLKEIKPYNHDSST